VGQQAACQRKLECLEIFGIASRDLAFRTAPRDERRFAYFLIAPTLRILCASHNLLEAERVYGPAFIQQKIAERRKSRSP